VEMIRKWFISALILFAFTQITSAKEVYQCSLGGSVTYQSKPCENKQTQKVACVNYAAKSEFKASLKNKCLDNGANNNGYGGYSSYSPNYGSSSPSSYSSGSSGSSNSSSNRAKSQYVSGYTRKDGTYVQPYMRSRK
jgi:hypothetical protein